MKRLAGIGAAAILFMVGLALGARGDAAEQPEPVVIYSTSFMLTLEREWKP